MRDFYTGLYMIPIIPSLGLIMETMLLILSSLIAVLVFFYLVYALFNAEKF